MTLARDMKALNLALARFEKGNPEFDPSQERDDHGRWTQGSPGIDPKVLAAFMARHGDKARIKGGSPANQQIIRNFLNKIPANHAKAIVNTTRFRIVKDLGDNLGQMQPSFLTSLGFDHNYTVTVAENYAGRPALDFENVVAHEAAHALDAASGWRISRELGPILRQEVLEVMGATFFNEHRHYFTSPVELFAQFYAAIHTGSPHKLMRGVLHLTRDRFPRSYSAVSSLSIG